MLDSTIINANNEVKDAILLYIALVDDFPPPYIICKYPDVIDDIHDPQTAVASLSTISDAILKIILSGVIDRLNQFVTKEVCDGLRAKVAAHSKPLREFYNEIIPTLEVFTSNKYPRLKEQTC